MKTRFKAPLISTIFIGEDIFIVRRGSKSDLEQAKRRALFEKCYHKGDLMLTQFEMGFMKQLDMFKRQK